MKMLIKSKLTLPENVWTWEVRKSCALSNQHKEWNIISDAASNHRGSIKANVARINPFSYPNSIPFSIPFVSHVPQISTKQKGSQQNSSWKPQPLNHIWNRVIKTKVLNEIIQNTSSPQTSHGLNPLKPACVNFTCTQTGQKWTSIKYIMAIFRLNSYTVKLNKYTYNINIILGLTKAISWQRQMTLEKFDYSNILASRIR